MRCLLVSAVAAVAFGIVHDSIDVHISPDFYRIFKHAPPTVPVALWAAGVGSVSAWWMGLLIGAAMLQFARIGGRPPLRIPRMYRWISVPLLAAAFGSLVGGLAGHVLGSYLLALGPPPPWPVAVYVVEGMHEGVYAGGFLGGVMACAGMYLSRPQKE